MTSSEEDGGGGCQDESLLEAGDGRDGDWCKGDSGSCASAEIVSRVIGGGSLERKLPDRESGRGDVGGRVTADSRSAGGGLRERLEVSKKEEVRGEPCGAGDVGRSGERAGYPNTSGPLKLARRVRLP